MTNWVWQPLSVSIIFDAMKQTLRGAGAVDYFDVVAVAFLIYLALRGIRQARAIRVLQGIFVSCLLYFAVRQTGMTLTPSFYGGLLTLVMISLVSLFQDDLRHFFERLTVYRYDPMHRRVFAALLRSVRHFSNHQIGALMVLKGRDPLDRHLDGGQVLNGRISSALLESLFDPHSNGHDGAAILDGNHVKRFGVHLPLSKNIDHDSGLGTRHAAALGMSEVTDAFCLVISETRGTVMVAHEGRLVNMGIGQELEDRLSEFLRERFQTPPSTRSWRLLCSHSVEKALSLVLGLALWLVFVKGIRPASQEFSLPVQIAKLPVGFQLEAIRPPQARVTVLGLARDLRALPPNTRVTLGSPRNPGHEQNMVITPASVHIPPSLQVTAISPRCVLLRLKHARIAKSPASSRRLWFSLH